MKALDKIYLNKTHPEPYWFKDKQLDSDVEYISKDIVVDAIKLAYGKVSMNPFDCSDAFEELLNKIGYEIH